MPQIVFWYWWVAAALLIVLEIFVPGNVLIWLGVSAGLVGILALVFPEMPTAIALLAFAVLSVSSVAVFRSYFRRRPQPSDHPALNRRAQQLVGRTVDVVEPIRGGYGKVRIGDSLWVARGEDRDAGTSVRVVGTDGTDLVVGPARD